MTAEPFTTSITGCARCHTEGHEDVIWQPLTFPVDDADGTLWTHWAPCPTNGEPILMKTGKKASVEAYFSETDDCWYVPVAPELLKYDDDFKDGIEPVRVQLKDGQLWITRLEVTT